MDIAGSDPSWRPSSDFYRTILETYGVGRRIGEESYDQVSSVLM